MDHTEGAPGLEQYGTTDKMEGVIYDKPRWCGGANNLPSAGRAQGEPLQPQIKKNASAATNEELRITAQAQDSLRCS